MMQGIVNLEKDGSDLQPYTYMESDGIELKHNNLCSIYTIVATETFKPQSTPHCVRGSMCVDQLKQKNIRVTFAKKTSTKLEMARFRFAKRHGVASVVGLVSI